MILFSLTGICIYVKKSWEPSPFLKQAKVTSLPNIVLRQLVKQIVRIVHSSKQVLRLLASEIDKMTIASILKVKCSFSVGFLSLGRLGRMDGEGVIVLARQLAHDLYPYFIKFSPGDSIVNAEHR